jgi:hypothetical protein
MPTKSKKTRTLTPGLTRRTHTKSRSGCLVCKHRKIKCPGEQPCCSNCSKRDLKCSYQSSILNEDRLAPKTPPRLLPQPPSYTSPEKVTWLDLRLLHHFLMVAYPHLPAGNDSIWQMQIPQIAHGQKYLMHALLGLSASHLHRVDPKASYHETAVSHRGHAIVGLNHAIANLTSSTPADETDAMLAAVYSLCFQASYMEDGLVDFMTMVRGCGLITEQIHSSGANTSFSLQADAHLSHLEPGMSNLPLIDPDILHTGLQSLTRTSQILTSKTEIDFFLALKRTLTACLTSTRAGFAEFTTIYAVWFNETSAEFAQLIDNANDTAKVLLCHYIALQMLMEPVSMPLHRHERRMRDTSTDLLKVTFVWARKLIDAVSLKYGVYLAWPETVLHLVERDIDGQQTGSNSTNGLVVPDRENVSS